MADGRHFENRYIAISQRKISSDFYEIFTAADFELDERQVIKNEKVALDRLRVRHNVFLVKAKLIFTCCLMCVRQNVRKPRPAPRDVDVRRC